MVSVASAAPSRGDGENDPGGRGDPGPGRRLAMRRRGAAGVLAVVLMVGALVLALAGWWMGSTYNGFVALQARYQRELPQSCPTRRREDVLPVAGIA